MNKMSSSNTKEVLGRCYVCNEECNPCSQTCGICARKITGYALGWVETNPLDFFSEDKDDRKREPDKRDNSSDDNVSNDVSK